MEESFYMLYVEGGDSPTFKHETLEGAETEAKRLAQLTKQKVIILTTIKSFEINLFKVEDLRPYGDLPF
jgi:hypothetical protein